MIKGIHHIAIICSERQKAIEFYCDALGFREIENHKRPSRNDEIIILKGHGTTIELFISENNPLRATFPEAYGLRHLAFCVNNLEDLIVSLKDKGYSPEPLRYDEFDGQKMTFIKDPDGLPIELHE